MTSIGLSHFLVVGAGAAGLMAARELACAGKRVTILEARERCGGRILPLPVAEFGYPAEGGAEFVHGAAPVTRALMREAGLQLAPSGGTHWDARGGALSPDDTPLPHARRFREALIALETDIPIAEFLETYFADRRYDELRRRITRMVEGYDAAEPRRASTFAIRDEWLSRGLAQGGRIAEGYGALIAHLAADCRGHGAMIHFGAAVRGIAACRDGVVATCEGGVSVAADAAILAVPLPLLAAIALPAVAQEQAAAAADIGFGNVVKILLRFATKWWAAQGGHDLADLSFVFSNAPVPTWWTQHPAGHPVLTGWYAGPKADKVASLNEGELVDMGLASLSETFDLPPDRLRPELVAARAINWGNEPFSRGAYSYATPQTRDALKRLKRPGGAIFFSGEALYEGPDMGTVEAALASGRETVEMIRAAEE